MGLYGEKRKFANNLEVVLCGRRQTDKFFVGRLAPIVVNGLAEFGFRTLILPFSHAESIALLMFLSTFCGVVFRVLAIKGKWNVSKNKSAVINHKQNGVFEIVKTLGWALALMTATTVNKLLYAHKNCAIDFINLMPQFVIKIKFLIKSLFLNHQLNKRQNLCRVVDKHMVITLTSLLLDYGAAARWTIPPVFLISSSSITLITMLFSSLVF